MAAASRAMSGGGDQRDGDAAAREMGDGGGVHRDWNGGGSQRDGDAGGRRPVGLFDGKQR